MSGVFTRLIFASKREATRQYQEDQLCWFPVANVISEHIQQPTFCFVDLLR